MSLLLVGATLASIATADAYRPADRHGVMTLVQDYPGCGGSIPDQLQTRWGLEFIEEFPVMPPARGARFVLRWTQPAADLDIAFLDRTRTVLREYDELNFQHERGRIPLRARTAALCLRAGEAAAYAFHLT